MKMLNQVKLTFAGRSVNEGFARAALAAFLVHRGFFLYAA